jgi:hypothetical protein
LASCGCEPHPRRRDDLWERFDSEALDAKFSQQATMRLADFYRLLEDADRAVVDQAVADWVADDDDRRGFDARALIREFEIRSAVPALKARLAALPTDGTGPIAGERAELDKLVKAIG